MAASSACVAPRPPLDGRSERIADGRRIGRRRLHEDGMGAAGTRTTTWFTARTPRSICHPRLPSVPPSARTNQHEPLGPARARVRPTTNPARPPACVRAPWLRCTAPRAQRGRGSRARACAGRYYRTFASLPAGVSAQNASECDHMVRVRPGRRVHPSQSAALPPRERVRVQAQMLAVPRAVMGPVPAHRCGASPGADVEPVPAQM
jgi:hypothetical protein